MSYIITKSGTGLKFASTSGALAFFPNPVIEAAPTAAGFHFPFAGSNAVQIKQGDALLQLTLADITSIGGVAVDQNTATLSSVLDALSILIGASSAPLPTGAATETTLSALNTKFPAKGQSTKVNSTPVTLASDQDIIRVISAATAGGNTAQATSASAGGTFVAYGSQACKQLTIVNDTGTVIEFQQDVTGWGINIPTGQSMTIRGITNASQIAIRRNDSSNTSVNVKARWES